MSNLRTPHGDKVHARHHAITWAARCGAGGPAATDFERTDSPVTCKKCRPSPDHLPLEEGDRDLLVRVMTAAIESGKLTENDRPALTSLWDRLHARP